VVGNDYFCIFADNGMIKAMNYMLDTCITAQDNYKAVLQYFEIEFD
jgi:hypothetical protein